jgi:hypothetical protein
LEWATNFLKISSFMLLKIYALNANVVNCGESGALFWRLLSTRLHYPPK